MFPVWLWLALVILLAWTCFPFLPFLLSWLGFPIRDDGSSAWGALPWLCFITLPSGALGLLILAIIALGYWLAAWAG